MVAPLQLRKCSMAAQSWQLLLGSCFGSLCLLSQNGFLNAEFNLV